MAYKVGNGLDLQGTPLYNAVIQNLASAPAGTIPGLIYYDTGKLGSFTYVLGKGFRPHDAALLHDGSIANDALTTNPLARGNHTGYQTASTISDFSTAVKAISIDQLTPPAADLSANSHKITALLAGVAGTDAVNLAQMYAYVASAVAGQTAIKNAVRVYIDSNVGLSGLGTYDGVTLAAGDRAAAGGQTAGSQNNIYVANSGSWTLATDADEGKEWAAGTEFLVTEGSVYGGSIFRQTTTGTITVGVSSLVFKQTAKINTYTADELTLHLNGMQFSVRYGRGIVTSAAGIVVDFSIVAQKVSGTLTGDGSTTQFNLAHNLGTTDVMVSIKDSAGNMVWTDVLTKDANNLTITFMNPPPNATTYRVMVIG